MENNLPEGWIETTVSEYAVICKSKGEVGRIPYLEIGDIYILTKNYELKDKPSVKGCKSSKKNDVLISRVRPTRGAITIIKENELTVSSAFSVLRFNESVEAKTVFYQLAFNTSFLNYLGENCTGTMYPTVSEEIIENYKLNLPPLAEQQRIVAKLDALFEKIESNKKRLEKIPVILKRFRQSVLAAAVSGKLTEDWREKFKNDTKASGEFLYSQIQKRIEEEVKLKKRKKPETFPVIEEEEKSIEIPESWKWVRLGSISQLINGDRGVNYPNVKEYVTDGIPWINTGHIDPDGSLSNERMNFITREKFNTLNSGKVIPTDIVYCLRGATLGKTAIVTYTEGAVASSLVIVRREKEITEKLIYYFMVSPLGRDMINRFDNGTAQPNLSANSVKLYLFPLPSLKEQKEIVRLVEKLFHFADKLEARYNKAKAMLEKVPESILAKAFRGELVSQNPDDEPASVLLERIKTEKEKLKSVKKKKQK